MIYNISKEINGDIEKTISTRWVCVKIIDSSETDQSDCRYFIVYSTKEVNAEKNSQITVINDSITAPLEVTYRSKDSFEFQSATFYTIKVEGIFKFLFDSFDMD